MQRELLEPAQGSYLPIEDYGAIGDGRSVALVSRHGSIDWLCLPHFSGPSVFAALLDRQRGGCFALGPTEPFRVTRRYAGDTNVLETRFTTEGGSVLVTDCLALLPSAKHYDRLRPQAEIIRLVEGCEGEIELAVRCAPRPDFARAKGIFEDRGRLGWAFCCDDQIMFLQGEVPLRRTAEDTVEGRFRIAAGEKRCLSFAYTRRDIAVVPPLGEVAVARVDETRETWSEWVDECAFEGEYRDAVVRSALVLKMLTYSLSGAVVAAGTTSLPEVVGGERNWDYRYCWLRDAAITFGAFVDLGYLKEAALFTDWLLHATRLSWPRLDVLYDVFGETHLPEAELDLEGYKGSSPVRIGNDAQDQLQLDVYGSVIQTAYEFVEGGGKLDGGEARHLAGLGKRLCKWWREPDEGIWEVRGERRHNTYSKMMCWVAFDRLLAFASQGILRVPEQRFREERDAIREQIETQGFDAELNSYVGWFGGETPDASLLLAARFGYQPANHPRMAGTYEFTCRELAKGCLLYRYPPGQDGLAGVEGAFGIASFWRVEYLSLAGRLAEARECFEGLLGYASDLGLYGEEIDPQTGATLGNFPQAFTHVGLIAAAMALKRTAAAQSGERQAGAMNHVGDTGR